MLVQISSGQGPVECELAVAKLYDALKKEFSDIELIDMRESRFSHGYTSIKFRTNHDLSFLVGSVQWICQSPIRPNHKRKNWFVDVSIIPEMETIGKDGDILFERFHCGGNGGQNVNKVETGVRLTHIPTGISVETTSERSQLLNRKEAMRKLRAILDKKDKEATALQANQAWQEHNQLIRGNPVRVYEGAQFKLRKR